MSNQVIIFVDISGSAAAKVLLGDSMANANIAKRLQGVENELRAADPTVTRHGPAAGDQIMLTGSDMVGLFHAAVRFQNEWVAWYWKTHLPVRISMGHGHYECVTDGEHGNVPRGAAIDLTARLLGVCRDGKVAVTESARAVLQASGLSFKLHRAEAYLKGFGTESYYETNGSHVAGSAEPERESVGAQPAPSTFWRTFAISVVGAFWVLGAYALYLYGSR